jgi:hypothetical protein
VSGKKFFVSLVFMVGIALLFVGCVSQMPAPVQQNVSISSPEMSNPPSPPSQQELEAPPHIVLEKPTHDPFMPLPVAGQTAQVPPQTNKVSNSSKQAPSSEGTAGYMLTGVIIDGGRSAIIQSGGNVYIVHQGDVLAGYRVETISPKRVVLVGKGGKLSLPLQSNNSTSTVF